MGKERSGTTLLQVMLNAHPNIVAPPESRFILLWYSRYGSITQWTDRLIQKFVNDLFSEKLFSSFWGVNKERLLEDLIKVKEHLNYPLICKIVFYYASPEGKEVKMFIDKNPIYYHFLPELAILFPEAKYIHIVRDYRDNMVSHKKIFMLKNTGFIAYHWVKINRELEDAKNKAPEKWTRLTYESLAINPKGAMENICNFLQIPFNTSMIEHKQNIFSAFHKNRDDARLNLFHENLFNPIDASQIGNWKQKLTTEEVNIAEAIAGEYAEAMYGYKKSVDKAAIGAYKLLKAKLLYKVSKGTIRIAVRKPWIYSLIRAFWRRFIRDKNKNLSKT
jgi:hypothetical protein